MHRTGQCDPEDAGSWTTTRNAGLQVLQRHGFTETHRYERRELYVPGEPMPFGGADAYYEPRVRGHRLKVVRDDMFLCVMPSPPMLRLHGESPVLVILRPEFRQPDALRDFGAVCDDLRRTLGVSIVVKSIGFDAAERLSRLGFRHYRRDEYWAPEEPLDEETYPESIWFGTEESIARIAPVEFALANAGINAFLGNAAIPEICEFYKAWRGWFLDRHPEVDRVRLDAFYRKSIDSIAACDYLLQYRRDERLLAVVSASAVSGEQVDVWFLLDAPGSIGRMAVRYLFLLASRSGVRFVNTGGSESAALHSFKRRLGCRRRLSRTHVVLPYN